VVPVRRASLWVAAVGFLVVAIGSVGDFLFPAADRFDFALDALGPWIIAVALMMEWPPHVRRFGAASSALFILALITFGALHVRYVISPDDLGTEAATHLGFIMAGSAAIAAALGIFLVMKRKEDQLSDALDSSGPQIRATFMQLLLVGVGFLLYGVDFLWVGPRPTNFGEFSLLTVALVLMLMAAISFREHLAAQMGRPAVVATLLALLLYVADWALHALSVFTDQKWHISAGLTGTAYLLGAVACVLAAAYKANASRAGAASAPASASR